VTGRTIVVSGAGGGIGRRLISEAVRRGHVVRAFAKQIPRETDPAIDWFSFDLENPPENLPALLADADAVIHLAAATTDETRFWQVNVLATRCLVEAMRTAGTRQLVLASAANLYASDLAEAFEDSPLGPRSRVPYLASKAAQEWMAQALCHEAKIACAVLRISSVFGNGRSIVDRFARQLNCGEHIRLDNGGAFGADLVANRDVAAGLLLAFEKGLDGVYNLSSGTRTSLLTVVQELLTLTGRASDAVEILPPTVGADTGFPPVNCDRLRLLGYSPTPLKHALGELLHGLSSLEPVS
jgi:nucleoside-diphosphate-sugar epimerase